MRFIFATLLCIFSSNAWAEQETIIEKDLRQLLQILQGEFNNYNQVNFQTNDFLEERPTSDYSRLHQQRKIIESSKLEGHWLYSQINLIDRDGKIYRQGFHEFYIDGNTIRSKVYKLVNTDALPKTYPEDSYFADLNSTKLTPSLPEGCDMLWQRELNQFVGTIDFNTCTIQSKYKDQKRRLFAKEIIGARGFWAHEGAYDLEGGLVFGLEPPNYYRYQRARPMTCWAAVNIEKDASGDDQWEFYRDLQTHDEGGSIRFGKAREYRLQLKQTEFPATNWSNVFEIFLYRTDEEKAFAYSWTEPSAKHIAVNLREVQASCKLKID